MNLENLGIRKYNHIKTRNMKKLLLILSSTILLSIYAQAQSLYIIGDAVSDWDTALEMKSVSQESGVEMYSWIGDMNPGSFKFRSNPNDWDGPYNLGSENTVTINGRTELFFNKGNCTISTAGKYLVFVQIYATDYWVYVMNATPEQLYIAGNGTEYEWNRTAMTQEASGVFSIATQLLNEGDIKFTYYNTDDSDWYPAFGATGSNVFVSQPFTNYDLKPLAGDWEDWSFNTPANAQDGDQFQTGVYYINVNLNTATWSFQPYISSYPEDGSNIAFNDLNSLLNMSITLPKEIESVNASHITISDETGNEYSIKVLGTEANTLIFQPDTENPAFPLNTDQTYTITFGENAITYAGTTASNPVFSYTFALDPAPTGIDATKAAPTITYKDFCIEADGTIEVYNMQGMLVYRSNNTVDMRKAQQGIYIARSGSEVIKIKR